MATPPFASVQYIDPWGIVPPGAANTGVLVTVDDKDAPSKNILIAQLLQGGQPLAYGLGGSARFLFVTPPGPLTDALPYQVQVQWAPQGTQPQNADWTGSNIATAPVLTSSVVLTAGSYNAGVLSLAWTPAGAAQPSTGAVQIVDTTGGAGKTLIASGGSGQWSWSPTAQHSYAIYMRAAALLNPSVPGVYTSGPLAPPVALPVVAPTLSTVSYDGNKLSVGWTPPALPTSPVVANPSYALMVFSGSTPVASFAATAGGGTAVVDLASLGANVTVSAATMYGSIAGPPSTGQAPLVAPPAIASAALTTSSGTTNIAVTLVPPPNLPAGASLKAVLLQGGVSVATATASGTPPVATLNSTLVAGAGYAVSASASIAATSTTPAVTGPTSDVLPLVTGAVSGIQAAYDGARLNLSWAGVADPNLTGYSVALAGSITGTYITGPQPLLSIPVSLNVGATATATVTPLAGPVSGLSTTGATFTVPEPAAPQIVDATVEGTIVTLAWSPSAGPWVDGYKVTFNGTTGGTTPTTATVTAYTGLATSVTTTLAPQTPAMSWSATVAATARGTEGPTSTAVALFPAVVLVTGISVSGATATINWSLSPNTAAVITALSDASASVQVQILDASNVVAAQSTLIVSTSVGTGSTAITLPAPPTQRMYAAAQLVAVAQTGSRGGTAAVLTTAPTVTFGSLADGALSLNWSATGDEGVTGYRVAYGSITATTTGTSLKIPLPSTPTGTITVTPVGAGTTGPAASQSVVSAYTLSSGSYSNGSVSVSLSTGGTPAPAQFWIDVLVEGALAARTVVAGAPSSSVTIPVAIPTGSSAVVLATGVGSGSITPPSSPLAIPSTPPDGVNAVWEGTNVHVAWTPVPDFGVTGYIVTVTGASPTISPVYVPGALAASASIAANFTGTFPGSAMVSVQAVVLVTANNYMNGPPSQLAVPSLAASLRSVAASGSSQPPFVYRRGLYSSLATVDQSNIVIFLANVFSSGTPTVQDAAANPTFVLAPVAAPIAGGPAYSLTLDKSVWTSFDGTAARAALRTAYRDLLTNVESKGVQPWGIALVRQAVAAALPQTFAELLYYRYGIWQDASLRILDLDSGIRLRVSGAIYQTTSASRDDRNGFVALGQQTLELGEVFPAGSAQSALAPMLTVDAFLAQLLPGGGTPSSTATMAASPMDFFGPGAREAYYRVFYPKAPGGTVDGNTFPSSSSIGSTSLTQNVAVVGASSWTALENATDAYASTGSFPTSGGLWTAYFRGRAAITPLVAVLVGAETRWVPAGTTLRQVLASLGTAPTFGASAGSEITIARPVANLFDYAQGGAVLRAESVDLSGADLGTYTPQLWPLDIPVLGGDAIQVTPAVVPGA
jgi:hypothetical protein